MANSKHAAMKSPGLSTIASSRYQQPVEEAEAPEARADNDQYKALVSVIDDLTKLKTSIYTDEHLGNHEKKVLSRMIRKFWEVMDERMGYLKVWEMSPRKFAEEVTYTEACMWICSYVAFWVSVDDVYRVRSEECEVKDEEKREAKARKKGGSPAWMKSDKAPEWAKMMWMRKKPKKDSKK